MYYSMATVSYYEFPRRLLDTMSVRRSPADAFWWNDGTPLVGVQTPIELSLRPLDLRSPEQSDAMPSWFEEAIPVVRTDLLSLLKAEGAALEDYEVLIHDPDSGRDHHDYRAVNVLGVIGRSALGDFAGSLVDDGESMEVGYRTARSLSAPIDGHRLAWIEDTFTLVAYQTLRDRVLTSAIRDLVFSPLNEIAI